MSAIDKALEDMIRIAQRQLDTLVMDECQRELSAPERRRMEDLRESIAIAQRVLTGEPVKAPPPLHERCTEFAGMLGTLRSRIMINRYPFGSDQRTEKTRRLDDALRAVGSLLDHVLYVAELAKADPDSYRP